MIERDEPRWVAEPFEVTVERRLRSLEDWRLEMRTVWRIVQLTFGTSLLATVVGIINLVATATGGK